QAVRIMLEPKSSRIPQDEFMAVLLAHTSLESSVSVNLTMVGRDGRPQQKNLLTILHEWIAFRFATVERRSRHRLAEVERRIHILEGRMAVFLNIDKVIRCIRESDEPKPDLMARFGLTELQAEDILEIRLRQLARLEGIRIEKELGDLRTEHGQLNKLLDSKSEMTRLIQKEIAEDAKRFGDERRTLMEAVTPISQGEIAVPDEPVTVIISKNGWVRSRQGHGIDPAGITYKTGDFPWMVAETRTVWPLIVIDGNGRSYSVKVSDLPGGRGDGAPLNTMIDFQEGSKLALAITAAPESKYLVAGSMGYGFVASVADMVARNKAGKAFLTLDKGEKPLPPAPLAGDSVAVLTQGGRLLIFPLAELKEMAKGKGLMLIDLVKSDEVVGIAVSGGQALMIGGSGRGGKPVAQALDARAQAAFRGTRARRGQEIPFKLKPASLNLTSGQ
ncbi:MAG: DNA topoisomerase IV subunit A, partial [Sulfuritalea sp.]|nr:DNA topoisomerase IV subunit A [Sulfuritalea sp.]